MIYMIADPEAGSRPVFDFGGKCAGMILAGDYWYFQGFDVTRSADAQKGIQVSGNHNILDRIKAYKMVTQVYRSAVILALINLISGQLITQF